MSAQPKLIGLLAVHDPHATNASAPSSSASAVEMEDAEADRGGNASAAAPSPSGIVAQAVREAVERNQRDDAEDDGLERFQAQHAQRLAEQEARNILHGAARGIPAEVARKWKSPQDHEVVPYGLAKQHLQNRFQNETYGPLMNELQGARAQIRALQGYILQSDPEYQFFTQKIILSAHTSNTTP
jgi:hypothetical protein